MTEAPAQVPPGPERWDPFSGLPLLTMAINITLIAVVFLTRGRWEAWVVERELPEFDDEPHYTEVAPDGSRCLLRATAHVYLLDAKTGETLFEHGYIGRMMKALFSPDGRCLAITNEYATGDAGDPETIREGWPLIVDTETGATVCQLKGHERGVRLAAFSPDGTRIATAGTDETARVWDLATGTELFALEGAGGYLCVLSFSPDGRRILTNSGMKCVGVWDAATGARLAVFRGHGDTVDQAEFCAGGSRVITASHRDKTCRIWDAATGEELSVIEGFPYFVLSPDGGRFATMKWESGFASIWDASAGALVARVEAETVRFGGVPLVFSPTGKLVVTKGARSGALASETGTGMRVFSSSYVSADNSAFTPDGTRIVGTLGSSSMPGFWSGAVLDARTGIVLAKVPKASCLTVLNNDHMLVHIGGWPHRDISIWRRGRPEWWWGVAWLWHFWVIIGLLIALALSICRDVRTMRRQRAARAS